jgi:hypothetical protein
MFSGCAPVFGFNKLQSPYSLFSQKYFGCRPVNLRIGRELFIEKIETLLTGLSRMIPEYKNTGLLKDVKIRF